MKKKLWNARFCMASMRIWYEIRKKKKGFWFIFLFWGSENIWSNFNWESKKQLLNWSGLVWSLSFSQFEVEHTHIQQQQQQQRVRERERETARNYWRTAVIWGMKIWLKKGADQRYRKRASKLKLNSVDKVREREIFEWKKERRKKEKKISLDSNGLT